MELDPAVLLRAPLPWLDGDAWWKQRRLTRVNRRMITKEADLRHALLALPFLESALEIQAHPRAGRHRASR